MSNDVVLFGHGFDGELISTDVKDGGVLTLDKRTILQLSGSSSTSHSRLNSSRTVKFAVTSHKSSIDGKVYLIGLEDGVSPSQIDLKISWQSPKPVCM